MPIHLRRARGASLAAELASITAPPIGVIILVDQVLVHRGAEYETPRARWQPFAAWAVGSGLALAANYLAPGLSTVVVGLVCSAVAYYVLSMITAREQVPVPVAAGAE